MLRIFVDSGSSIKQEEKEKYNVEIIPLRIMINDKEYDDGVDLTVDKFYEELFVKNEFPKTSLPNLVLLEEKVTEYTNQGDDVIILTISSKISGTYNALNLLFEDNAKVRVIDSKLAVGGIRILVNEINKYRDNDLDFIENRINKLIPRVKIMAIPETLSYLFKGGRLSKTEWIFGSVLRIKPIIGFVEGKVSVLAKKIGLKKAKEYIADALVEMECDEEYEIIAAYTYDRKNVDELIEITDKKYLPLIKNYDNLDPAIACHWGPNAFGYIFVSKK